MTLFKLGKDFSSHEIAIDWPWQLVWTEMTKASWGGNLVFEEPGEKIEGGIQIFTYWQGEPTPLDTMCTPSKCLHQSDSSQAGNSLLKSRPRALKKVCGHCPCYIVNTALLKNTGAKKDKDSGSHRNKWLVYPLLKFNVPHGEELISYM